MAYQRPTIAAKLSKQEKVELLKHYIDDYRQRITRDNAKATLNQKVSRQHFANLLDEVGALLWDKSGQMAESEGPVRDFLATNPLPPAIGTHLPDRFRVFCLALNSLKQWIAAEQAATDRYLLGGNARELCRAAVETCLVTGGPIGENGELHHPVRDGRPPIMLSKEGHALIEDQVGNSER